MEQVLERRAKLRMAGAGGFEERGPCLDGLPQRRGQQCIGIGFGLVWRVGSPQITEVFGSYRSGVCERGRISTVPSIARSRALALSQSRSTVRVETASTSAVSSSVYPAK